jgi:hypothetical protein
MNAALTSDTDWTYVLPPTEELTAWIQYLETTYDWVYIEVDVESGAVRLDRDDLVALVDLTRDDDLLRAVFGAGRRRLLRQLGFKEVRRPL